MAGGESGLYVVVGTFSSPIDTFALTQLWHNGAELNLASKRTYNSVITAQGKDVYVAGNNGTSSVYWKNGVVIGQLSTPANMSSYVTGIALSGADVYVAGVIVSVTGPLNFYPSIPVYWKNGALNYLQHPTTTYNNDLWSTTGITISGSDIYISGDNISQSYYWKNGVCTNLPNGSGRSTGIAVSGTDVYVIGEMTSPTSLNVQAGYWKNGVAVYLPNPNNVSQLALAITIKGTDIYVAGRNYTNGNSTAVYWKNGTMTILSKITGPGADAYAIFIDTSNNVYICGTENMAGQRSVAAYWLNSVETILSTQPSVSTGLVYVQ